MTISTVAPYPMPADKHLPENRVPWCPDAARSALLVHDMQRYFLRPYRQGESPLCDLLVNSATLIDTCRELGVPVLHTAQSGTQSPEERGLLMDFWGKGLDDVVDDTAIVDEVVPDVGGVVLRKRRYSAFYHSDLDQRLRSAGRDQLIICGVYAHIGCTTTAVEAFSRNFEVFFAADAVADFSAHQHMAALAWVASCCAVVAPTRHITDSLLSHPTSDLREPDDDA